MKIAVSGAGIIGITTPGELESDGYPIQVLERRDAGAEKSSFANAMGIAPGHLTDRQQGRLSSEAAMPVWFAQGLTLQEWCDKSV